MDDPATLERRLDAGDWLRTGEVAALLGVSRGTIHNWVKAGTIGHKRKGGGIQRVCNPEDVRRLLNQSRQVHGGTDPEEPTDG